MQEFIFKLYIFVFSFKDEVVVMLVLMILLCFFMVTTTVFLCAYANERRKRQGLKSCKSRQC